MYQGVTPKMKTVWCTTHCFSVTIEVHLGFAFNSHFFIVLKNDLLTAPLGSVVQNNGDTDTDAQVTHTKCLSDGNILGQ